MVLKQILAVPESFFRAFWWRLSRAVFFCKPLRVSGLGVVMHWRFAGCGKLFLKKAKKGVDPGGRFLIVSSLRHRYRIRRGSLSERGKAGMVFFAPRFPRLWTGAARSLKTEPLKSGVAPRPEPHMVATGRGRRGPTAK